MDDERTPLMRDYNYNEEDISRDPHKQFCMLVGIPPSDLAPGHKKPPTNNKLYYRAKRTKSKQNTTYIFTATMSNMLLLTQVVLGATLTALGASESSHILITIFGVFNTIIAGLVAYLKSRGQPMRARMFRDDLEHVVGEIENSEIMWLGISRNFQGYDPQDIDDNLSVRNEVARLTRLYDRAVKNNTTNNPDMYFAESLDAFSSFRAKPGQAGVPALPPVLSGPGPAAPAPDAKGGAAPPAPPAPAADPDESPATKKPDPEPAKEPSKGEKKEDTKEEKKDEKKDDSKDTPAAPAPDSGPSTGGLPPASTTNGEHMDDESPATKAPEPKPKVEDKGKKADSGAGDK